MPTMVTVAQAALESRLRHGRPSRAFRFALNSLCRRVGLRTNHGFVISGAPP